MKSTSSPIGRQSPVVYMHTYENKIGMNFQETNQAAQRRQHMEDERWKTGSVTRAPV